MHRCQVTYWSIGAILLTAKFCCAGNVIHTIAASGLVPAGETQRFRMFGIADLNNRGQVAFTSNLSAPNGATDLRTSIWLSSPDEGLTQVAPPLRGYGYVVLNDLGDIAYRTADINSERLVVRQHDGTSRTVAAYGQSAPGATPPGGFSGTYPFTDPGLNNSGDVVFTGGTNQQSGIWVQMAGALQSVANSGQLAVDDPQQRKFSRFFEPRMNDSGQTVYWTDVLGQNSFGYPESQPGGIYTTTASGESHRIIGPGDHVMTDRGPIEIFNVSSGGFQINNAGNIMVLAQIRGLGAALLLHTPEGLSTIAAENDPIGDDRAFYFRSMVLSSSRTAAYIAMLLGPGQVPNDSFAIIKNAPGESPVEVARSSAPAPGGDGLLFSGFMAWGGVAINGTGQVAFGSSLKNTTDGAAVGNGIWAQDRNGQLRLVAKTGDQIDVDEGPGIDIRTFLSVGFAGGPSEDGFRSHFNDRGELLFSARFTDGSEGLFLSSIATIPEPPTLVLAAFVLWVPSRRRHE